MLSQNPLIISLKIKQIEITIKGNRHLSVTIISVPFRCINKIKIDIGVENSILFLYKNPRL
ncbi:MAG: hypothetical protein OP8BY_2360 [Candidatus Saccharicenans subterraneus]|uniref:Uncharacterized protein n=1 Tax=Candidatus Saccharicenans subterraneus TaxID=2508984 RepID=A0A3E2BMU4_9BACT|nr:MAG: hypothetical protein OP8BY_2360 [Candidatus Saccharicenans subterraneum]